MTTSLNSLRLDISAALANPPPLPDHVLPGLPAGTVGALVAPGGAGKTMLALSMSIALATGRTGLPGFGIDAKSQLAAPVPVVLVTAEESADEMHRRLHHITASLAAKKKGALPEEARLQMVAMLKQNLIIYPLAGRHRLRLDSESADTSGLKALEEVSTGARLVILDPLRQFHSGDENDSWAMTSLVQKLQGIASRTRCALLLSHHTNQQATMSGTGELAGAARGSAALTDAVRWQLNLSRLDIGLAKSYGIQASDLSPYICAGLAKANYIVAPAPLVFRKDAGGVLTFLESPLKSLKRSTRCQPEIL